MARNMVGDTNAKKEESDDEIENNTLKINDYELDSARRRFILQNDPFYI